MRKIGEQIGLLESVAEPQLEKARATFELLERSPEVYMEQDDAERAALLRTLISNCTVKGENLVPGYEEPFSLVAEGLRSADRYVRQGQRDLAWSVVALLGSLAAPNS